MTPTPPNKTKRILPSRKPEKEVVRLSDEMNPDLIFRTTHTDLLAQIAKGTIRTRKLALRELRNRGLDRNGLFIGFDMGR